MAEVVIGEANKGGTITLKDGDSLVVQLPENPTTGFRWGPTGATSQLLQRESDDFAPAGSSALGAGGMRTFRYRAKGKGNAVLSFALARSWESGSPASTFEVNVTVD
jgi:inhibitor of cysteine peptidase